MVYFNSLYSIQQHLGVSMFLNKAYTLLIFAVDAELLTLLLTLKRSSVQLHARTLLEQTHLQTGSWEAHRWMQLFKENRSSCFRGLTCISGLDVYVSKMTIRNALHLKTKQKSTLRKDRLVIGRCVSGDWGLDLQLVMWGFREPNENRVSVY